MAIDSTRLLTDSAAQLWRRLQHYAQIEALPSSSCYEDWIGTTPPSDPLEDQALRRDYRRLHNLLIELATLVAGHAHALELVRERVLEAERDRSLEERTPAVTALLPSV